MPLRTSSCHDETKAERDSFDFIAIKAFITGQMNVIGHIVAGARALSFGGPLGALLDRAARYLPRRLASGFGSPRPGDPRAGVAFTIAVIALGAKMAKADGTVSRDEVAAFREVFQVPPGEEAHLRLVFDLARRSTTSSSHSVIAVASAVRSLPSSSAISPKKSP